MRRTQLVLLGAVLVSAFAGPAFATPADFLTKALKGDNSETKLGSLAARNGHSKEVRAFGAMLSKDHRLAREKTIPIAARYHVSIPSQMAPEAQLEYAKLHLLRGTAFDHEFSRYMVKDHQNDIADFEKEAKSSDPSDLRALARQSLPVLRKHLATASSIG
jgi:putative membrane protein